MSTLVVRLDLPGLDGSAGRDHPLPAAVIARVSQLLGPAGDVPPMPVSFEYLLAMGGDGSEIEVAPGLWNIEVALPSGELLARQVRMDAGSSGEVAFDLGATPRDWLSWQFAEGSVPGRDRYEEVLSTDEAGALQSPRGVTRAGPKRLAGSTRRGASAMFGTPVVQTDAFALSGARPAATAVTQVSLLRLRAETGLGAEGGDPAFAAAVVWWSTMAAGLRMDASIKDLPGLEGEPGVAFEPGEADRWHQVWRLSGDRPGDGRRFALVVTSWAAELVSLPLPWPSRDGLSRSPGVELVIDKSEVSRPSRTSVTLQDADLFGLLSYLKMGAFASAGRVARREPSGGTLLVDLLKRKRANPLAACAAGYALLAGTDLREERPWHDWIGNLDRWFESVPDGALMHGRLLLARGKPVEVAKEVFLRAFARGLPFYALGLEWLLEGLRQFGDDERCAEAASLVREVTLRSDVSQAFTVLRLRPPADLGLGG